MEQNTALHSGDLARNIDVDVAYHDLEEAIERRIVANIEPLFTTDADPKRLWAAYVNGYPPELRKFYTCTNCRHFIERYGGLVRIDPETGVAESFLWRDLAVPPDMRDVVDALHAEVRRAQVRGVFVYAPHAPWGVDRTLSKDNVEWTHLHGTPSFVLQRRAGQTTGQREAELRADFLLLLRAVEQYPLAAIREAVRVLGSDSLTRSEKALGVASWFLLLQERMQQTPQSGPRLRNHLWRAAATAPIGFAHISNTVLGTLLDDIVSGLSFVTIRDRWAKKLHPGQYQRPTAAPKEGQIDVAERKVRELGLEPSLLRRFAMLGDVQVRLWEPKPVPIGTSGGVFDQLRTGRANVKPLDLPAQVMSWDRFQRTVLSDVLALEVFAPAIGNYYGLVTATVFDAPPILQWDGLDGCPRNPVSWYVYVRGSPAAQWGLEPNSWQAVSVVFEAPHRWHKPEQFAHQPRGVHFAIPTAHDRQKTGLSLFPEMLRAELREIRAVIEAFSQRGELSDREVGNVNGLGFGGQNVARLRARTAAGVAEYHIDRWE